MYLPECREILWFSYGSAAAAGYGGYGGGYGGGGGGYREISTFGACQKNRQAYLSMALVYLFMCPSVNSAISSDVFCTIVMKLSGIVDEHLVWNEFQFLRGRAKVKVKVIQIVNKTFGYNFV